MEDLREPAVLVVDPERSRFWVSDSREGEVLRVGVQQRVTEFVGKEEVISWRCGAALQGGGLCQRQDRRKCPFHGIIVKRDEQGRPLAGKASRKEARGSTSGLEKARGSIFDLEEDDGKEEGSSQEDHEQGSNKEPEQGSSKEGSKDVLEGNSQEQGSDDEQGVKRAVSEGVARATKKAQKRAALRGAERWDETARSRLEKKVFNRAAVGRVTRDLLKYRKIRTKDKFVDQFNY